MTYRLLVTGTRFGRWDAEQWFQYMVDTYGEPELVVVGDAVGVDMQLREWCKATNRPYQVFEADWDTWPHNAGNIRNTTMAEFTAEVPNSRCLGLPMPQGRGTYHCLQEAERCKLSIVRR